MPEQKEQPTSPLPQPEWKHDFSPGPSEEEMSRVQGPEWRSKLPDIRMQFSPAGENADQTSLDLMRLLSAGRATSTAVGEFGRGLESFETATDIINTATREELLRQVEQAQSLKEKKRIIKEQEARLDRADKQRKEALEKLKHTYGLMVGQALRSISKMYDKTIDQKKNAYPYDHREAEFTIQTIEEAVDTLVSEKWLKSEEGQAWLQRLESDTEWLGGFLQLSVAESASTPYYWDVITQLQTLKERFRAYATEETFERVFASELPGTESPPKPITALPIPEQYQQTEESLVKPDEVLGLRELATRMQDASFETRMKLAAASQADLRPNIEHPETTTFLGTNLKKEELEFFKALFWDHKLDTEKGKILTPYLTSKAKEYRQVTATLEAILLTNAYPRLETIISGSGTEEDKSRSISNLVKEVEARRNVRVVNWFKRDRNDIVSGLASLITRAGYLQDYSLMHAYRYCWGYTFKTTKEEGKVIEIKQVEIGGIHTASGDITSLYWARRGHKYDLESNSRTQFLFPTEGDMRVKLSALPLGEMFPYKPEDHQDAFLKNQWNRLFSDDAEYKEWRKSRGYPDIPKPIAERLKSWAWIWRLPYNSTQLGEATEYPLDIPMLMPPRFDAANFFENVRLGEGLNAQSVWEKIVKEGVSLSQIDWQEMDMQQIDRWLVEQDMGSRFMRILIEPFDPEKDPFFDIVTRAPSTLGPKEAAKRLRLCFRDNIETPHSIYEVAFIPFLVTLACANKWGITSPEAWELSSLTSEEVAKTRHNKVDGFIEEMAYWRRALWWLPGERGIAGSGTKTRDDIEIWEGGDEYNKTLDKHYTHYGKVMALLGEFYQNVLIRYTKTSAIDADLLAKGLYNASMAEYNSGKDYEFLRKQIGDIRGYKVPARPLRK